MGESIRTRHEYLPWLEQRAADILQPDIGRSGISEAMALASIPNLYMLEYQPPTLGLANKLLDTPIELHDGCYRIPDGNGLGVRISERRIRDLQA